MPYKLTCTGADIKTARVQRLYIQIERLEKRITKYKDEAHRLVIEIECSRPQTGVAMRCPRCGDLFLSEGTAKCPACRKIKRVA